MSRAALLCLALFAAPLALMAQTAPAGPATKPAAALAGDEKPAVNTAPREDLRDESGTTIVGERESPIGLYITPWRNAYSEQDIDRPPRLLQVDMSPIDKVVFARQIEYYDALTEASRSKLAPTVAAPASDDP